MAGKGTLDDKKECTFGQKQQGSICKICKPKSVKAFEKCKSKESCSTLRGTDGYRKCHWSVGLQRIPGLFAHTNNKRDTREQIGPLKDKGGDLCLVIEDVGMV